MSRSNPIINITRAFFHKLVFKLTYFFSILSSFLFLNNNSKKKGRGRPKLHPVVVIYRKIIDAVSYKRHRGRPKKISTIIKTNPVIEVLPLPKRERGRPRHFSLVNIPPFNLIWMILKPMYLVVRYFPIQTITVVSMAFLVFYANYFVSERIFRDLPVPTDLTTRAQEITTQITDRNGKVLYKVYENENRTLIPLSDVPNSVIYATIAIEDKDFYSHHGFSIRGISRAIVANLKGEQIQGGSTLTQQLVKNRLLSTEQTFTRKIRELILAVFVESTYTKDEILEMYFNQIAYGGSTYGIQEAAQRYFGKNAKDLTLAEAALLAGLPAAPSAYTPFGANPEYAYARQHEVLRRMAEDGYITYEQAAKAQQETLSFVQDSIPIVAPHFVMYVRDEIEKQYGNEAVNGGLIIRTTLDADLQKETEQTVRDEVASLTRLNVNNGAAMITNPQTGEILTMVGSVNYFDFANDGQVNVPLRPRQPGSSIKPLTYAIALERGKSPLSKILDEPITYEIAGSKPYSPKNYDGKFHGNVTLKEALASSYNIPAVKLLEEIGLQSFIDKAEKMGISTWQDRTRYGLSITLGGGEVYMKDMTQLYGAFANGGYAITPNPILEVTNYKGETLYRNECVLDNKNCEKERVLNEGVAFLITDMLSDNSARTPAFGPLSTLYIPNQQVAVKTGTTNNLRDNWTFGYTTDRLVSVWVGNNNNESMSYIASGVTGASSIWNTVMRSLLTNDKPHTFTAPESVVAVQVCASNGSISCGNCGATRTEYYLRTNAPSNTCAQNTAQSQNKNQNPRAILRRSVGR